MIKWLFGSRRDSAPRRHEPRQPVADMRAGELGEVSVRLADVEQTIGGIRQLTVSGIDEMAQRKHDLDYQLRLCRDMMRAGDILPFPFERAAILLRKSKRFDEEIEICRYVEIWCREQKANWDGRPFYPWKSPVLQRCIGRIPKAVELSKKAAASKR